MEKKRIMVDVDHVTIRFNLANQKVDNLKEYCIRMIKKELMFQEFLAVKDVSFQIGRGEAWGIIGSNGSGKSTLLKAISGIIKPYKGKITVNGRIAPLIELGAGFDGNLTARENIFLNGCILGHTEKYMKEHFEEIVDFAGLWDFLDSPIKNYSSGMKARLGFSVATSVKPDLLIVDEILSVGDMKFKKKCQERITEMLDQGTTLIYVSHSMQEIEKLCQHVVWLEKGDLIMNGSTEEICQAYLKANE
ncbi:MAG: ABC transporter ATP-binding protein [Lachnospiraceae bacterium]|nr:ABC transporter ATP-binding protein [Lachnospiraceae bacterium]